VSSTSGGMVEVRGGIVKPGAPLHLTTRVISNAGRSHPTSEEQMSRPVS
jgi:hypothetical protein